MEWLSKDSDIWVCHPIEEDLYSGARYAAITLPWTFNRMMKNTTSRGQQERALNIVKGIVGQEVLRRVLDKYGVKVQVQIKSYREEDFYDLRVPIKKELTKLDLKSVNYYTNYDPMGREPLTPTLIIENMGYCGPDWRKFFPMLVPHTQIGQEKEIYCFAIASSIDFRLDIDTDRVCHALTAFPYGDPMVFLSSSRLCQAREAAGKGFYIECSYTSSSLFNGELKLNILGEWGGKEQNVSVKIKSQRPTNSIGPFSCLNSIQIDKNTYERLYGQIIISVCKNDFTEPVRNSRRADINVIPKPLHFRREDFCNLILPSSYTLYFLGWIPKEEFLERCRSYVGWIWPNDSSDEYKNQPWNKVTEDDRIMLERIGFADCISSSGSRHTDQLQAGIMKTTGRGNGACCYVYPNLGGGKGGVRETNLYILPQDLYTMDSLVSESMLE